MGSIYSIGASGLSNKPSFRASTKPMGQNSQAGSIFNNGKGVLNSYSNDSAKLKDDSNFFKKAFLGLD